MKRAERVSDPSAGTASSDWSHEESYRGFSLASAFHRIRLRGILAQLRGIDLPRAGALADFGCSNGFILEQLQAGQFPGPSWRYYGFDHSQRLLAMAEAKHLPDTTFTHFSLTEGRCEPEDVYDLVLCLETLEHTGDYRQALANLWRACKPGGYLLLSMPIEVGVPGLLKFFGRRLAYRDPYSHFFGARSRWPYVRALLVGGDLSVFREPGQRGYASHFGFDNRRFDAFLRAEFLEPRRLRLGRRRRVGLGLSVVYLLAKAS